MLRRLFGGGPDRPAVPVGDPVRAVDATIAAIEAGSDTFAIFDVGRGRYVQVTLGNVGLYGEAVSNAYLKREALLDNEALRALTTMGWSGGGAGSNFSRTWERWTGTDRRQVVDDIVGTLRLVYEMPPTGPLDITTGS